MRHWPYVEFELVINNNFLYAILKSDMSIKPKLFSLSLLNISIPSCKLTFQILDKVTQ